MRTATLRRKETGDTGTFGTLEFDGFKCLTGELPERGNAQMISCIPAGTYLCKWTYSPRHEAETYQIMDVPGRTGVRFDIANLMGDEAKGLESEVDGCVALGYGRGMVRGQAGIIASGDAIREFDRVLAGEDFELTIVDEYLEAGAPSDSGKGVA